MEGNSIKIKFSPFEALLIGEKNRVVKRQPQKNTVFVSRLNKVRKSVNLRELFDLKRDPAGKRNGSNEKFENVCDFLKHCTKVKKVRKTELYNNIKKKKKRKDVYCYEFGGRKLIVKGDEFVEFKVREDNDEPEVVEKIHKIPKTEKQEKTEKKTPVKFKPDFKFKETLEEKIVNKFHNRRLRSKSLPDNIVLMDVQKIRKPRQLLPRGPDGKFLKSSETPNNVTPRQKFLSKYLHEIYLKKNKDVFNKQSKVIVDSDDSDSEEPYSSDDDDDFIVLSESNKKFDVKESETKLNQISVRYHQKYSTGAINFPPYPKRIRPSDFDDDDHLIDILYEDQPRSKFEAKENYDDFGKPLKKSEIVSPAKKMKVYERKKPTADDDIEVLYDSRMETGKKSKDGTTLKRKNGFVKTEGNRNGFNIKIEGEKKGFNVKVEEKKNGLNVKSEERKNGYNDRIDQPPTADNHLLEGTNLGTLFFDSVGENDIFLGNFVKPVLNESPFGTIPNV